MTREQVTQARRAMGLTQVAFARHLDVSESLVRAVESGRMPVSGKLQRAIERVMATLPESDHVVISRGRLRGLAALISEATEPDLSRSLQVRLALAIMDLAL